MNEATGAIPKVAFGIMCKVPIAGACKTRLTPAVSSDEAAELSRCFIADLAATIAALPLESGAVGYAVFTPAEASPGLDAVLPPDFARLAQRGEDLTERCVNAIDDLLADGASAVCLVNGDSPTLPGEVLQTAANILRQPGRSVVLGPAMDGGYYLVGLRRSVPELFHAMPWSTGRVLAVTEARARTLGLTVERLPKWYDVDDGMSLAWLLRELAGDGAVPGVNGLRGAPAPRTRACLAALTGRGQGAPPVTIDGCTASAGDSYLRDTLRWAQSS